MYLISVIIPVYNAEYFIDECFYSVLNKNNSIEIILIDDCSTDNTKKKLIEYTKKYNVKYFDNKRPWHIKCDIAIPCATQNEINKDDADKLVNNN